jgi:hypothetical protein
VHLPFPSSRKRRTREHVIADLSVNHVERQALLCGFTVERVRFDYGIDLIVHTHNRRGEIENGRILFQVKASDRIRLSRDKGLMFCRLDRADIHYWLGETMPVILVQYDARKELACWLHIQEHARNSGITNSAKGVRQLTLAIPFGNQFDRNAMRMIAQTKNKILSELAGG